MIRKISKLNKIGKFASLYQEKNFQYGGEGDKQNCNIIFGFNGSGKTTISNAISLFANDSFVSDEEKAEIFDDMKNNDDSVVELELEGKSRIKYPASNNHNKNIFVFNQNFIITHVFDGTRANLKKFANVGGEIKNSEIDAVNMQIDKLNEEKNSLINRNNIFDKKHKEIAKRFSAEFSELITDKNKKIPPQSQKLLNADLPGETICELKASREALWEDYKLSKQAVNFGFDLQEIRQLSFSAIDLNLNLIDELLSKNIQQLSKEVLEKKIKEVQSVFSDEQHKQKVESWFRFGKDVLEKVGATSQLSCPICGVDVSEKIDDILLNYHGYFDKSYEEFISGLENTINGILEIIDVVKSHQVCVSKLKNFSIKYKQFLNDCVFEKYSFNKVEVSLNALKDKLKQKQTNIQNNLTKSLAIGESVAELNRALKNFDDFKNKVLGILESKQLNTHAIEDEIRSTYKKTIILEFNQADQGGCLQLYKDNRKEIQQIDNDKMPFLHNKLTNELKKIKAESKSISRYLVNMGIDHFDVDINEDKENENIIIRYKNSIFEKNKIKNCLSESEKTALAFAYFLSKLDNERNSVEKIKESVVIIDDPISSLDDNRLYSTAHLICKKFKNVRQLIVLSHNLLFLKYFNSSYRKHAACFFLDDEKLLDLPDELRNFETPYFYMLRDVINFLDQDNQEVTYNKIKKHLPNFIRRVLETFLSFKFSRISGKEKKFRSPGLNEFDEDIESTNLEDSIKKDLKEKISEIDRISSPHSHGNAHHIQEHFYISEQDLKTHAQNALYVMDTMDKLHTTCFVDRAD